MSKNATGSVMLETIIALPVVLVVGLSIVQWAFIHEARAYLDHATLMAARAGALNHAEIAPMRNAFARAITPLHIGKASSAHFETTFATKALPDSRLNARLEILNPTQEAFRDHARRDRQGRRFLPFRHLDQASRRIGRHSQLNIQDATLLRVKVTYGYPLKVPYAGWFIIQATKAATRFTNAYDARERLMLAQNRLPIVTTAAVRLQTRAYAGRQYPKRRQLPDIPGAISKP